MPDNPEKRRWEDAKSAVLALLVVLSLVLSFGLWWSAAGPLKGEELWKQETPSLPPLPDWSRVVVPTRLLVHASGDRHLLFSMGSDGYREIWEGGCLRTGLLDGVGPPVTQPLRDAEVRALEGGMLLEARFATPLPGSLVARAYRLRGDVGDSVEALVFTPERWPYIAIRRAGQLYPLEGAAERDFRLLAQIVSRLASSGVMAPQGAIPLISPALPEGWEASPGLWVPKAATVPRLVAGFVPPPGYGHTLVGQFFADPTVVRRIEERDGATIFTDGRSGLRVYPSGALEYNTPRPPPARGGIGAEAALSVALSFLATHGGIPADMLLWGCWPVREEGGQAWALGMGLAAHGLVVLAPGGAVSLAVGDQGLYGYRAAAWLPWQETAGSHRIMPAQEALVRLAPRHPGRVLVEDMYLAYVGNPVVAGELRPTWVVRTGAALWAVDAVTGKVQSLEGRW